MQAKFRREADIALKLKEHPHENIVTIFDVEVKKDGNDDVIYIVMEKLTEGSLFDRMRMPPRKLRVDQQDVVIGGGKCPEPLQLSIAQQLCSALQHLHNLNFVHRSVCYVITGKDISYCFCRDLTLNNLMLHKTPEGTSVLKVIDFGCANNTEHQSTMGVGTPSYQAPEYRSTEGEGNALCVGQSIHFLLS